MRVLSPKFLIPALFLAAASLTPAAWAQVGTGLPQAVVNANTIGPTEQKAIDDHVGRWLPDLGAKDAEKVKKAREALVSPVLEANVSVPFRLAYSKSLTDGKLADLCTNADETVAINALRLAGEVAEIQTVGLVKDGFADKRSAVRYAAVFAALRTFEQVMPPTRSVAVPANTLEQLVTAVAAAMNKDKEEALTIDAASRALLAAARVERPKFEGVAKQGAVEACRGLSKRVASAAKDDWTVIEAAQRAANQFQQVLGGAKGTQTDAAVRAEAAGLGGELVAWTCRQLNAAVIPQGAAGDAKSREPYKFVLAAGENVVLSAVKAAALPVPAARLVPAFEGGDKAGDAKVVVDAGVMFNDILAKAPFDLPAGRFKVKP